MEKNKTPPKKTYPIALSFDLEYWWCSELLKEIPLYGQREIIAEASEMVLDLLDTYDTRATFFVLGEVAEKYPELIRKIHGQGHEIAAHGYSHSNVFSMTPEDFREDLIRVTKILSSLLGEKPLGFRAPNFSVDVSTPWVYRILNETGYKYSSSIFPFKTAIYGVPEAPLAPYFPSADNVTHPDPEGPVLEFPGSVLRVGGHNIPVSGGFYFRLLPVRITALALRRIIGKRPAVFYLHLRDLYPDPPRLKGLPLKARIFHYYGIRPAALKLKFLLSRFSFLPVKAALGL
ncbi:MAG: DUF3473 domain-containing protein [Candidatus Aminicenantes bacterium]|nr:DUF3473 domain-containing protein [Candidatus Aminicenantes bacterium]